MDSDTIALVVLALAALAGCFFTVVPLLPGTLFVLGAAIAGGFLVGWEQFAWWSWALQALLVAAYLVVDNVAQALGVKRVGGSRSAMVGGAVGVMVGPLVLAPLLGPLALLLGPPLGAVVGTLAGEARARRGSRGEPGSATAGFRRLGTGALVTYVVSVPVKLLLLALQVALVVAAIR